MIKSHPKFPCENHHDRYAWIDVGENNKKKYLCRQCYLELLNERREFIEKSMEQKSGTVKNGKGNQYPFKPSVKALKAKYARIFRYLNEHHIAFDRYPAEKIDDIIEQAEI